MKQAFHGSRDVVTVTGPDATPYLQGQVSQDVAALGVGESAWSFILQPQGKVDAWFRVTRFDDEGYFLDVDTGYGEVLLARLKRFLLRTKAELSLETWDWRARLGELPEVLVSGVGGVRVASIIPGVVDLVAPDFFAHAPFGEKPDEELISESAFQLLRIRAGVPAMGSELDENTIPAEARIVNQSVSFTKGCYTGQELVARVDSRGDNTPRKLRIVTGSGLPEPGVVLTLSLIHI